MTDNTRIGIVAIVLLIIVWFLSQLNLLDTDNKVLEKEILALEEKAVSFSNLQKRWGKKGQTKKLLRKLEMIKAFDKRFKKGPNVVISYDDLSSKLLNRLSYALFASDTVIVSVHMKKTEDGTFLKVEMKL